MYVIPRYSLALFPLPALGIDARPRQHRPDGSSGTTSDRRRESLGTRARAQLGSYVSSSTSKQALDLAHLSSTHARSRFPHHHTNHQPPSPTTRYRRRPHPHISTSRYHPHISRRRVQTDKSRPAWVTHRRKNARLTTPRGGRVYRDPPARGVRGARVRGA